MVILIVMAVLLLVAGKADAVSAGIGAGLQLCGARLIPDLLPMTVLCAFAVRSGAAERLMRPMRAVTERAFHLPAPAGGVIFTALIGGYPVGAQGVRALRARGVLTTEQGDCMMRFCICAGPGFAVQTVGTLFGSRALGAELYAAQAISALILGLMFRPRTRPAARTDAAPVQPVLAAFTDAVADGAEGLIRLCAYVCLFAGLNRGIGAFAPEAARAFAIVSEVGSAMQAAQAMGRPIVAAFALGFGGLCVHAQLHGITHCPRGFIGFRILHGALTAAVWAIEWALIPVSVSVAAVTAVRLSPSNVLFSLSLLGTVAVCLASASSPAPSVYGRKLQNLFHRSACNFRPHPL